MVPQQNILINSNGKPLLADFGLSKVCPSAVHRTYGMTDPCVRNQIMEDLTGMPFTQSRGVSDTAGDEGVRAVDAGFLRHAGEGRARREGEREAVGVVRWALCEVRLFLSLLT